MKKPYYALSDAEKQRVHQARKNAGYTYKKLRYSIDETFYYNKYEI